MKFSKKIVVSCIIVIVLYTVAQLFLSYKLMVEISPTLTTCVYAFFGTEMAACACIRIFDREQTVLIREDQKKDKEREKEERLLESTENAL